MTIFDFIPGKFIHHEFFKTTRLHVFTTYSSMSNKTTRKKSSDIVECLDGWAGKGILRIILLGSHEGGCKNRL